MIKKATHIIFFFISLMTVLPASAYDFESGGIYYIIDGHTHTVTVAAEKYSGTVNIPAFVTYNGTDYAVTGIEEYTFFNCDSLTSITVDSANTEFASVDGALYNKNITELIKCPKGKASARIPASVTEIGDFAFYNCHSLTSITVDSENTAYASVDGVLYNKDITELIKCPEGKTSVRIPNSVTMIVDGIFSDCSSLTSITVDSANSVYASADGMLFNKDMTVLISCPQGKTSVRIPNTVTTIGDRAFMKCNSLTSIKIPDSVTTIGYYVFGDCSSLISVEIPNSVTKIEDNAFDACSNLTSITVDSENKVYASVDGMLFNKDITELIKCPEGKTSVEIPNSMTKIENYVFSDCSSLTSVKIPDSVTKIGDCAFSNCSSLTSVKIPKSVTTIGNNVFYNCKSLTSIIVDSENKVYASVDGMLFNKNITELIICPEGKTSVRIPKSVTTIEENAFSNCSLTSVEIPKSVTTIGNRAFSKCSGLTSVRIPNSVTTIEEDAFSYCSSLTSVKIPKSVTTIENHVFFDCKSLISVEIPNSVTTIGACAFGYCCSLKSIKIPDSVTTIEIGAFTECTNLTSVEIPNSVTTIGTNAFYGCNSLKSIKIPNSMTTIEDGAFSWCISMTSVKIPKSVTTIGNYTFSNCSSLKSIKIPASVTEIGYNAFYNCQSLTSITVDSKNRVYTSVDGALYNKNMTELIADPTDKTLSEPEQ